MNDDVNAAAYLKGTKNGKQKKTGEGGAPWLAPYQWKAGQSGNPSGRPKGADKLSVILRDMLDDSASAIPEVQKIAGRLGLDPERTTIGATLAASIISEAANGNVQALREILDRVEGKPDQGINIGERPTWTLADFKAALEKEMAERDANGKRQSAPNLADYQAALEREGTGK